MRIRMGIQSVRRIRQLMAQLNPDIVHALWLWDNAFNAWVAGGRPLVLTAWGSDIRNVKNLSPVKQLQMRWALRSADAVTAFGSDDLLKLCQAMGAKSKCCHSIGAPGIDVARFENPKSTGLLGSLGLPRTAEIILSCRAMQPYYRIDKIVDAFKLVEQIRPSVILLLVNFNSYPGYLERIQRRIVELNLDDSVRWLENVEYDQMPELYSVSSIMVSIPVNDGMPQTVLEAFAAGCPVVAADLQTYDGVLDDGRSGIRVQGDDPKQIAQAILRILGDANLRRGLVAQAHQVVRERGDMQNEMAKMEQLYFALANGRAR